MDARRRKEEYSKWVLFVSRFCSNTTENVLRNSHRGTFSWPATSSCASWTPSFPFLSERLPAKESHSQETKLSEKLSINKLRPCLESLHVRMMSSFSYMGEF